MAKCPEPSLVMRLADKGRTWAVGPILLSLGMVQTPSGPCLLKFQTPRHGKVSTHYTNSFQRHLLHADLEISQACHV
ncbi:hypothetical protein ILYODFUR_023150 [Ilyodon furcidens]|uniref:Uncharacterized protein n=1 Tax=Ilyodon furcidens TaxID=33524 RepID=A0ABV0TYT6_9TELE